MVNTRTQDYVLDGKTYQAFIASPDSTSAARPAVLVAHAWAGRSEFENDKAVALAELGYTGVAIDLYGKGVLGSSVEENQTLMSPFVEDRDMLRTRLLKTVDFVRELPEADASKIAAIGFCFGGLCVISLARAGAEITGVVSFHGLLGRSGLSDGATAKAKVLALHGWDDPMVPPEDVTNFAKDMTEQGFDWQLHGYGGVMHAFTNPAANDPDFGTVYDASADSRSWIAMQNFLSALFA